MVPCLISIVSHDVLAVARISLIVDLLVDLCVVHKQISVAVSGLRCDATIRFQLITMLTANQWGISEHQ